MTGMGDGSVDVHIVGQPDAVARVVDVLRASLRAVDVSGNLLPGRRPGGRVRVQVLIDRELPDGRGGVDLRKVRASVTDAAVLRRVTLASLVTYLESHGWAPHQQIALATWWRRSADDGTPMVLVPRRGDVGDYELRIADALTTLAAVEDRSQLAILADLLGIGEGEVPGAH
jgi:hypothetical protein